MKRFAAIAVLALACAACSSTGVAQHLTPTQPMGSSPSIPGQPAPATLPPLKVHDPGQVTGIILNPPCHLRDRGQLPDVRCTPGAYDPAITAAMLCSPTYSTSSYRPPESQTSRFKYGMAEPAYGQHHVSGELDHLIPLELAGANDAANLWVEAGKIPNAKDKVENALHDWVCAGPAGVEQLRLMAAQTAIALDWKTAEAKLGIVG